MVIMLRRLKNSLKTLVARTLLYVTPQAPGNELHITVTIDTESDVNKKYRHTGTYRNIDYGIPKLLEIFDKQYKHRDRCKRSERLPCSFL